MDFIGNLLGRLIFQFWYLLEWAVKNWLVTMIVLVVMIYWAGHQRRTARQHS